MYLILSIFVLGIARLFNQMTMEVILSTAFGRSVNVQNGQGGRLYESALEVFGALSTEGKHASTLLRLLNLFIYTVLCPVQSRTPYFKSIMVNMSMKLRKPK